MLLYFSGTGNSRWVANSLAKLLNERVCALLDVAARPLIIRFEGRRGFGICFSCICVGTSCFG